jgi:hypothetical protein
MTATNIGDSFAASRRFGSGRPDMYAAANRWGLFFECLHAALGSGQGFISNIK